MDVLTLPVEVAQQIFEKVITGPAQRGITLRDEKNEWVIGKDYDEEMGIELIQIHVSPLLKVVNHTERKFKGVVQVNPEQDS